MTVPAVPESQLAGWPSIETADVQIVGHVEVDEILRLAEDLAYFDATFAPLIGQPVRASAAATTLYVFREPQLARNFVLGGNVLGWAQSTLDGSVVSDVATTERVHDAPAALPRVHPRPALEEPSDRYRAGPTRDLSSASAPWAAVSSRSSRPTSATWFASSRPKCFSTSVRHPPGSDSAAAG